MNDTFASLDFLFRRLNGLYFAALLILLMGLPQLYSDNYVSATEHVKFTYFGWGLSVILFLWGIRSLERNELLIRVKLLDTSLLAFLVYIVINRYFTGQSTAFSLRYFELLGLALFYLVIRSQKRQSAKAILAAIVVSGMLQMLTGGLQYLKILPSFSGDFDITGTFHNPAPFSGFVALSTLLILGLCLFKISFLQKPIGLPTNLRWYLLLIVVIAFLLLSQSRAAVLAVIVSATFLLYSCYKHLVNFKWLKKRWRSTLMIPMAFIAIGIIYFLHHHDSESISGRFMIWKVGGGIVKDYPVLGIGYDRFQTVYMDYQAQYFQSPLDERKQRESHIADDITMVFNEYLQVVVELGLVGILLLGFVCHSLYFCFEKTAVSKICIAALVLMAVFSFFSYPHIILSIKLVVVVLLALFANESNQVWTLSLKNRHYSVTSLAPALMIAIAVSIFFFTSQTATMLLTWKKALTHYKTGDYENALGEFSKIDTTCYNTGELLFHYGKSQSMSGHYKSSIRTLLECRNHLNTSPVEIALGHNYMELGHYKQAIRHFQKASDMIPSRLYPLYLLVQCYWAEGCKEEALVLAKEVVQKEVKIHSMATLQIKRELEELLNENQIINY